MRAVNRSKVATIAASMAAVSGCALAPQVKSERSHPTGIARDLTVGAMVLYHERCAEHRERTDGNCAARQVTAQINADYARCLERGFQHRPHRVKVLPGDAIHTRFLAQDEPDYANITPDRAVDLLSRQRTQDALTSANIAYVVLLSAKTVDSNRSTQVDGGIAPGGFWGIARSSTRVSTLRGTVFSTAAGARAGTLELTVGGKSGWAMPILLILPMPPIPFGSPTEKAACKSMGDAIAEFLYSTSTPDIPGKPPIDLDKMH